MPQFVLIHSPLVGPSSLVPTADALSALGFATYVPTPNAPASHTRWCEWPLRLLDTLPELEDPILVGHVPSGASSKPRQSFVTNPGARKSGVGR